MAKNRTSLLNRLSRFIFVISAVSLALNLWSKGLLDAQKAAVFLVIVVIGAAIDSVWMRLIIALFGIGYFIIDFLNYDLQQFQIAAVLVGALLLALFGIYIIVGGIRKK